MAAAESLPLDALNLTAVLSFTMQSGAGLTDKNLSDRPRFLSVFAGSNHPAPTHLVQKIMPESPELFPAYISAV